MNKYQRSLNEICLKCKYSSHCQQDCDDKLNLQILIDKFEKLDKKVNGPGYYSGTEEVVEIFDEFKNRVE